MTSLIGNDFFSCALELPPVKTRAVLTKLDALAIYQIKSSIPSATKVAKFYGLSDKAIRDIWTARTWAAETWHLDKSRVLKIKQTGRPIGRRDSKPRKARMTSKIESKRVSKPAVLKGTRIVCSDDHSGEASDIATPDSKESLREMAGLLVYDISASGQSAYQSTRSNALDDQLSDWRHFWHKEEWSDPFASDWLDSSRNIKFFYL